MLIPFDLKTRIQKVRKDTSPLTLSIPASIREHEGKRKVSALINGQVLVLIIINRSSSLHEGEGEKY